MKIATWNVERLKHRKHCDEMKAMCEALNAEILVLTETDNQLKPRSNYTFSTTPLGENEIVSYRPTERRVAMHTKFPCIRRYQTHDEKTSLCVELDTPLGALVVYGTIIGVLGNRHPSFQEDLRQILQDLDSIPQGSNICLCGDFNCSFSDNYYFTHQARNLMLEAFEKKKMVVLTCLQPECIDHIAVSHSFVSDHAVKIHEWNGDKRLSDHKGILVNICEGDELCQEITMK